MNANMVDLDDSSIEALSMWCDTFQYEPMLIVPTQLQLQMMASYITPRYVENMIKMESQQEDSSCESPVCVSELNHPPVYWNGPKHEYDSEQSTNSSSKSEENFDNIGRNARSKVSEVVADAKQQATESVQVKMQELLNLPNPLASPNHIFNPPHEQPNEIQLSESSSKLKSATASYKSLVASTLKKRAPFQMSLSFTAVANHTEDHVKIAITISSDMFSHVVECSAQELSEVLLQCTRLSAVHHKCTPESVTSIIQSGNDNELCELVEVLMSDNEMYQNSCFKKVFYTNPLDLMRPHAGVWNLCPDVSASVMVKLRSPSKYAPNFEGLPEFREVAAKIADELAKKRRTKL